MPLLLFSVCTWKYTHDFSFRVPLESQALQGRRELKVLQVLLDFQDQLDLVEMLAQRFGMSLSYGSFRCNICNDIHVFTLSFVCFERVLQEQMEFLELMALLELE